MALLPQVSNDRWGRKKRFQRWRQAAAFRPFGAASLIAIMATEPSKASNVVSGPD
jgi:hypothetical protein